MIPADIENHRRRIDDLFKKVSRMSDDLELQSQWACYLCALLSGFLEVAVRATYREYTRSRAHPNIQSYVTRRLNGFRNPNMERILQLAGDFSPAWRDQLEQQTAGKLADHVNGVVARRNQIAHGVFTGLTYSRVREYYESVVRVVRLMGQQCT